MTPDEILRAIAALPDDERRDLLARLRDLEPKLPGLSQPSLPLGPTGAADALLVFDGGSKGNPGPSFGSFALSVRGGEPRVIRLRLGVLTNNEAEYSTLIRGLEATVEELKSRGLAPGEAVLEVRGDSALVINQLKGEWKVKEPRMGELRDRARGLLSRFKATRLIHQPRAESVKLLGH